MHELEETGNIASMAFAGDRRDIWHGLGQSLDGLMTTEEAMRAAHMNRTIRVHPVEAPVEHWAIPGQYLVILGGEIGFDEHGNTYEIPDKVVGITGEGGAQAHLALSMRQRFDIAEFTLKASQGGAIWSTAGMLRDGRQGFACMQLDDTIIDPNGVADRVSNYATMAWSFDASKANELGDSQVRVVCANTMRAHDYAKHPVIKFKMTSASVEERAHEAAQHWALAQNRAEALKVMAERLLAIQGRKMDLVNKIVEKYDPKPGETASKRTKSLWASRQLKLETVAAMPSNDVGDNAWAAYNVWTEYLDWFADVRCTDGATELDCRYGNQFDGTHDARKAAAAQVLLGL
jgi:hypothetical protein